MSLRDEVDARLAWPLPGRPADADAEARQRALDGLVRWLELVRTWNAKIDLTAAKDDADLAELGVLDAVEVAGRIDPRAKTLVDVGTGFGAPGLAIAILRPDLAVTLVEPLRKRATFLRTTIGALGIASRVAVEERKGEPLADAGARFDVAISRATLAPPAWLALGDRLAPEGEVVLLLARDPVPATQNGAMEDGARRVVSWDVRYVTRAGAPRTAVGMRVARHGLGART